MPATFLNELILIITAAFVGGFIARSLRLPAVLGYIVSGIVFGMLGKHYFSAYSSLVALSQLGVSLLLFTLGFEISFDSLKKIDKKIFLAGFLQVIISALCIFPLAFIFGVDFKTSLLFSTIFAFSSTAVIVKILEEKEILNEYPSTHIFVYLLIQDLFIVPVIFLLPIVFSQHALTAQQIGLFLLSTLKPLVIFIFLFVIGKFFLSGLIRLLYQYPSHELTFLATIFLATISIGILKLAGIPETIAAFLAGVLISEQGRNIAPLSEIRPLRDLFLVLFFVITGMLLDSSFFVAHIGFLVLLTSGILAAKFVITTLILLAFDYSPQAAVFIASYLSNIGEFAIVLGQIAFIAGFINADAYNMLLSVFVISLFSVPIWSFFADIFTERLVHAKIIKLIFRNVIDDSEKQQKKLTDHVIICGHGRVGAHVRKLLDMAHIPYIVIDFDKSTISDLTDKKKNALFGDPADGEVLKTALIEHAKVLVLAISDSTSQKKIIEYARLVNPDIVIVVRADAADNEDNPLSKLNINSVVVPELEAGIVIGREVLQSFDVRNSHITSWIKKLKGNALSK